MARSIFISHAVKDKEISNTFVSFLERALQIPQDEIFCSSIPGDGIPIGKNFTAGHQGSHLYILQFGVPRQNTQMAVIEKGAVLDFVNSLTTHFAA